MLNYFPYYYQLDSADCGPTCLRMIAKYYGRTYSVQYLREHAFITREGVSMLGISDAAQHIGFRTMGIRITLEQLEQEMPLPCILHWNQRHFVVCYKIRKGKFCIADPAAGRSSGVAGSVRRSRGRIRGRRCCSNRDQSSGNGRNRKMLKTESCRFSFVI